MRADHHTPADFGARHDPGARRNPGARRTALRLTGVLAGVQTAAVLLATQALAAPDPNKEDDSCRLLSGPSKTICENNKDGGSGGTPGDDLSSPTDPLTALAKACGDAASWTVDKLSEKVEKTADVDFTNPVFLKQYAVVFAASTILTLLLWLLAVAKRAVRGVPMSTAIGEAVGFLWLTVLASAFTPLILYTVVSAADGVSDVLASATGGQSDVYFGAFSKALSKGEDIGGGPIMLIVVSLVSIVAAGVLCLELVIRAALLYLGALLGTVVYSGLVDKNLWGQVRRWAAAMVAIILIKPIIVIVLGLAGALSASDEGPNGLSAIVSGLSIILLAIFASGAIYRFVPGFGDEIASVRNNRFHQGIDKAGASAVSSPAALVKQGIKTHSGRSGDGGSSGGRAPAPSNAVSGGIAAHSTRASAPESTGGSGGTPRSATPANTPHAGRSSSGNNRTGGDGR